MKSSSVVRYIDNYLDSMMATQSEVAEIKASIDARLAQIEAEQPQAETDQAQAQAQAEHVTYRQEYVKCGKPTCTKCSEGAGHGPYWYGYRREGGKLKKQYIGKNRPAS